MTSLGLPADAARRSPSPGGGAPRPRRPTSRLGVTWLVACLVLALLLVVQVGRQVYASYSITQQADALRQQIGAIQQQNEALQRQLGYLRSDAYVGAEARRLANLGQPGERLLIIPPGSEASLPAALQPKPAPEKPLLEQWLELFFGG